MMIRYVSVALLSAMLTVAAPSADATQSTAASAASASAPVPEDAVQKGTYTSEQLQKDLMPFVYGQLQADGCLRLDSVTPYVTQSPVGELGSRHWVETWVFACPNGADVFDFRLQETADGGADYNIKKRGEASTLKPADATRK